MTWTIVGDPQLLRANRDTQLLRYVVERQDGERREVFVELTGTAAASSPDTLPSPIDGAVRTRGRELVDAAAERVEPFARISISTTRVEAIPRQGAYEPGDRVFGRDGECSSTSPSAARPSD